MTFLTPISNDIHLIIDYITEYDEKISQVDKLFDLNGKVLSKVCQEIPKRVAEFKICVSNMKAIEKLLEIRAGKIESKLQMKYTEGYSHKLSATEIKEYIKGEPEIMEMRELLVEVNHITSKLNAVLDGLDTLHWQTNNMTKLAVASLEEYVL